MKIKGSFFLNLFIVGLVWYFVNTKYSINYTGQNAKIFYIILFLVYVLLRIAIYFRFMGDDNNRYRRPNVLPKLGEGFMPQYPNEKARYNTHNFKKPEIPFWLEFMPLFFVAFIINKTVIAAYKKTRDWSNNYLTINLEKNEN